MRLPVITRSAALVSLSLLAFAVAFARASTAIQAVPPAGPVIATGDYLDRKFTRAELALLEDAAIAHAPFSLATAWSEFVRAEPAPAVEPEPRALPPLQLRAIVGGPPWQAVIAGLPGARTAIVVRVGASFPPVRVRSISAKGVVVATDDTTWSLSLPARQP